ncbi:MAG: efflux RND transporter periplasmic adaptor subunit [Arcobacteraceae bacterium]
MKRKILFTLSVLIVLGIGYTLYINLNSSEKGNSKPIVVKVIKGNIENLVTSTGTINPKDYVDVGTQVSGQLEKLYIELGDVVKKGDLLGQIDVTVFKAKVDQSKAQLKYQEAQFKERKAQLELAKTNYTRQKELYKELATSLENFENAKLNYDSSLAQIEMIQAQIEQSRSSIQADEANLEYTRIYAPMDGTVVSISAKQGQTLNANQNAPVILQIADLSTMTVKAQVSEADINKLQKNMHVYFKTLGNNKRWHSTLDKIEPTPTVENNVVLYNVLFDVQNQNGQLMTYMTTQVFFVLDQAQNALLVPINAINGNENSYTIKRVESNGNIKEYPIKIGVKNRVQAQILEGVNENDSILLNSSSKAQPPSRMNF